MAEFLRSMKERLALSRRARRVWLQVELWWKRYEWFVFAGVMIGTVVLGMWGFRNHPWAISKKWSFWDILYRSLQLFVMESGALDDPVGPQLQVARLLAPLASSYLVIRAMAAVFRGELQRIQLRLFTEDHVVVCGLGRRGWAFVKRLTEEGWKVVVVEKNAGNALISLCEELGANVIIGDATNQDILRQAGVVKAKYLIAVSEGDETNIAIQTAAAEIMKDAAGRVLTCILHVLDPNVCQRLSWDVFVRQRSNNLIVDFFSIYRTGSQRLLEEYPAFEEKGSTGGRVPSILVVGTGNFARELVERLGRQWWLMRRPETLPLNVVLVGEGASHVRKDLLIRHKQLAGVCNLMAYDFSLTSAQFHQGRFLFDEHGYCDIDRVYVCAEASGESMAAALALGEVLGSLPVPMVTVVEHESASPQVRIFPWLDRSCDSEMLPDCKVEIIARALHAAYVELSRKEGETPATKPSMVDWDRLPEEFKDSNRQAASYADPRMHEIGCQIVPLTDWDADLFRFTGPEVEFLAEKEHDRWVKEREAKGWKLGDRDDGRKRSPYMRPWSEISESVREYDRQQVRVLPRILASVDFEIVRVHYELLAMELHGICRGGGAVLGERRDDYSRYTWRELGKPSRDWYRNKADMIVRHLRTLCYTLVPSETVERSKVTLSEAESRLLWELLNDGRDFPEGRMPRDQLGAVAELLQVLRKLGFSLRKDRDEIVARALHDQYLQDQEARVRDLKRGGVPAGFNPSAIPWHELPENKRDSNREAARHIPVKLATIGYGMRCVPGQKVSPMRLSPAEIEVMARMEHDRWIDEQIGKGWSYAPGEKDVKRRTSPYLIPWTQLSEDVRDWDRKAVGTIPAILASVGCEIYPIDSA
jgi:hypothetical protein